MPKGIGYAAGSMPKKKKGSKTIWNVQDKY